MKRRRRQPQQEADDQVIDLRDLLAPYDGAVVRPPSPMPRQPETTRPDAPELFTSLEFDFEYRMGDRS